MRITRSEITVNVSAKCVITQYTARVGSKTKNKQTKQKQKAKRSELPLMGMY